MARHIVRVITPGTVGEETVLVAGEKNFLLAVMPERRLVEESKEVVEANPAPAAR